MPGHDLPPPPAPVVIMSRPYMIQAPRIGLLDRVMPSGRSWAWLWKIRYALFGRIKAVNVNTSIIDFTGSDSWVTTILPANPDFIGADGLRVWRLREHEVRGLRELFKERPDQIVASCGIATGDKVECSVYSGISVPINGTQQPIGLSARVLPSIRNGTTDLTAIFSFSEALTNTAISIDEGSGAGRIVIKTNFDLGGRFQLPREMASLFILPAAPASTNQKRVGLLLTSDQPQSKK